MAGNASGEWESTITQSPEDTMRNMGLIASPGMEETEKTIVEIMENK